MREKISTKLRAAFALFKRPDGRVHAGVLAAFLFVNGLALVNAVLHDPRIGYDAGQHLSYIVTLAKGHTPSFNESRSQSFTPPLSYALPSLLLRVMAEARGDTSVLDSDLLSQETDAGRPQPPREGTRNRSLLLGIAAKSAQLLNWLFSVGLTLYLLKTCELIRPNDADFKFCALVALGMLPVYYKTFSFIRGEPLGTFLVVVAAYYFLRMLLKKEFGLRRALTLGFTLGLAMLSRQWSFLILPAFACSFLLTWRSRTFGENKAFASALVASVLVAALASSWFYLSYPWGAARPGRFGTYMTKVSDPISDYKDAGGNSYWTQVSALNFQVNVGNLFTTPVRDSLADEIVPIFYSDTWGDYWGYFLTGVSGQSAGVRRYLGRVNLVSLLPTAVLLSGLCLGVNSLAASSMRARADTGDAARESTAFGLLTLLVAWSLAGFAYFLLVMPNTGYGVGVKAAYMLQIFPFVALLASGALVWAGRKSRRLYRCALILLVCVALHNVPAMITHYFVTTGRPHLAW